jgi:hypothetical protein
VLLATEAQNYALVCCLFLFLFVVLEGGLRLNPGGAFLGLQQEFRSLSADLVDCVGERISRRASRTMLRHERRFFADRSSPQELTDLWNSLLVQSHGKGMA